MKELRDPLISKLASSTISITKAQHHSGSEYLPRLLLKPTFIDTAKSVEMKYTLMFTAACFRMSALQ